MSAALVTGATLGIGRSIAETLGRAGYGVGVIARNAGRVESTVRELQGLGISAAGASADVADPAQAQAAVRRLESTLGETDVLVNNAGIARLKPFDELTLADWDETMATNLRGMFLMTREVLPGMRRRRRGAIVNIASLAGRNGFAGGSAYAASKHGVLGFSKSLMLEVRKDGIRVIAICPGSVDTPLMEQQDVIPGNRNILRPEDVSAVVLAALQLPPRALVSELDIRPTNP